MEGGFRKDELISLRNWASLVLSFPGAGIFFLSSQALDLRLGRGAGPRGKKARQVPPEGKMVPGISLNRAVAWFLGRENANNGNKKYQGYTFFSHLKNSCSYSGLSEMGF